VLDNARAGALIDPAFLSTALAAISATSAATLSIG